MTILDLEYGRPDVLTAERLLLGGLSRARSAGERTVKLIHGYGSHGVGGAIRRHTRALLREPLRERTQGGIGAMLSRIVYVLSRRSFSSLLVIFSVVCMPFMAFLAVSSYIYQGIFGLSPQTYSLFFAINAGMSLLGPLCYGRWFADWPLRRFFSVFLGIIVLSGLGLLCMGHWHPVIFALWCAPISFCSSATRPPSTVLMLNQLSTDTGTMTALINSGGLLFGSASMFLCGLSLWPDSVTAMGGMACLAGLATLLGWRWVDGRGLYRKQA